MKSFVELFCRSIESSIFLALPSIALANPDNAPLVGTDMSGNLIAVTPAAPLVVSAGILSVQTSPSFSGTVTAAGITVNGESLLGNGATFTWTSGSPCPKCGPLVSETSLAGSFSGSQTVGQNLIQIDSDTLAYTGANYVNGLLVNHNYGGPSGSPTQAGARAGIEFLLTETASDSGSPSVATGIGLEGVTRAEAAEGGTGSAPSG